MDGKAFAWQRHYMQNMNNKHKTWQQILQDAGSRFDTGAFDDPVAKLARLKQEDSLIEYLERFDTLLARIAIPEELALSFFLSSLIVELEKSVRVHRPSSIQEAVRIARLQDEVLHEMTKKFSPTKLIQADSQAKYSRNWFVPSQHHRTIPITTLHQQKTQNPTQPTHPIDSKVSTANNNSRK